MVWEDARPQRLGDGHRINDKMSYVNAKNDKLEFFCEEA